MAREEDGVEFPACLVLKEEKEDREFSAYCNTRS